MALEDRPLLQRLHPVDLEVRSGGDGRTVHGIAVPFDSPTNIRDDQGSYLEVFRAGAFAKTISETNRVKFLRDHRPDKLIGRAVGLREDAAGLYAELRVSATRDGDEVLELIRDGALDALSVGFIPVLSRRQGEMVERVEVALREISATPFAAYAGATISEIRSTWEDTFGPSLEAAAPSEDAGTREATSPADTTKSERRLWALKFQGVQ